MKDQPRSNTLKNHTERGRFRIQESYCDNEPKHVLSLLVAWRDLVDSIVGMSQYGLGVGVSGAELATFPERLSKYSHMTDVPQPLLRKWQRYSH